LTPLGLFLVLRTSIPFTWRVLTACLPAWTPWLRGPVSPRYLDSVELFGPEPAGAHPVHANLKSTGLTQNLGQL
jgi:hypothetical protein